MIFSSPHTRFAFSSRTNATSSTTGPARAPEVVAGSTRRALVVPGPLGVNIAHADRSAGWISCFTPKVSTTMRSSTEEIVPAETGVGNTNQSLP